ncbi:MAG: hypothetical protein M1825_003509 [Sarcosagium campestre]|nr:MAG: hypothetical protein M1825_003509 [Sarcosagium campestre]
MSANPVEPDDSALIEADSTSAGSGDDSDSAVGDDLSNFTASLTESVVNYPYENGRRYHAYKRGAYLMPNDDKEADRMDLTHAMLRHLINDKIHLAPIGAKPQRVLDVGTGTGLWAIEFGDEYPSAEVIGTDLSPIQPNHVPVNVKFEVDDCEEPWTFPGKFDFIHSRYLAGAIRDWPKLIKQMYEYTAPGGWVEFQDYDFQYYSEDGSVGPEEPVLRWDNEVIKGFKTIGCDPLIGPKLKGWAEEAGYVNVVSKRYKLPIGPWAKDKYLKMIGAWNMLFVLDSLEAVTLGVFVNVLGWSVEETQVLLAQVRTAVKDPSKHAQFDFYIVYGQRPKDSGDEPAA